MQRNERAPSEPGRAFTAEGIVWRPRSRAGRYTWGGARAWMLRGGATDGAALMKKNMKRDPGSLGVERAGFESRGTSAGLALGTQVGQCLLASCGAGASDPGFAVRSTSLPRFMPRLVQISSQGELGPAHALST